MERTLREYYENQFDLFNRQGWKELMTKVDELLEINVSILNAKDEQELYFRKGAYDVLRWIKGWEASVEEAYKQNLNETEDAKDL